MDAWSDTVFLGHGNDLADGGFKIGMVTIGAGWNSH